MNMITIIISSGKGTGQTGQMKLFQKMDKESLILKNIKLLMVSFISLLMTGVFLTLSLPAYAEGQCLEKLEVQSAGHKKDKQEIAAELAGKVKQDVIAKTFKRVNPRLEDYAASKFSQYVMEAASEFQIDPFLIASILIKESTVKYKARSHMGAYGLMQINWRVHKNNIRQAFSEIDSLSDLIQPRNNIFVGTYIFSCYLDSSNGDVKGALARYLGKSSSSYNSKVFKYHRKMVKGYSSMMEVMLRQKLEDAESA